MRIAAPPTCLIITGTAPDLTISMSHTGNFRVGSNGAYTITVSNVGSAASSGMITVTDTLPPGLSYISATGTGWSCSETGHWFPCGNGTPETVTCTNSSSIAAGATANNITVTVAVTSSAASNITGSYPDVTNTAALSNSSDSNTGNNSAGDTVQIFREEGHADLTLSKRHTGNFTVGSNGVYTIVVSNVGTWPSGGLITVTDTLPAGLSYVSVTDPGDYYPCGTFRPTVWSCSSSGQTVTCIGPGGEFSNNGVDAGTSASPMTLTVAVAAAAAGTVTNTAVLSNSSDSNTANNTATDVTTVVGVPDLTISKSHNANFAVGTNGTYTITVSNTGSLASAGSIGTITVTDILPTGLSYVSASGSGWTCSASGQTVTCNNPGSVAAGSSASGITLTVGVSVAAVGTVINTATVSGGGDNSTANNSASDTAIVIGSPTTTTTSTATTSTTTSSTATSTTSSSSSTTSTTTTATASTTTSSTTPPPGGILLSILDGAGGPGANVDVPVYLSDGSGIAALQLDLSYDPALIAVVSVSKGSLLTDHALTANTGTSGRVRVAITSLSLSSMISGVGTVAVVTFRVNAAAVTSTSQLLLSNATASGPAGTSVPVITRNGTLRITGPTTTSTLTTTSQTTSSSATTSSSSTSTSSSTTATTTSTTGSTTTTITLPPASPIKVFVSPVSVTLTTGATLQFAATVTGIGTSGVTWSVSGGSITPTGFYTAPSAAGTYTVAASSIADPTKSASAKVTVTSIGGGGRLYFAQFGNGSQSGETFFSEINLTPLTSGPVPVTIEINDDAGNPLTVNLNGLGVPGKLDLVIPTNGGVSLRSDGLGPIQTGSVVVTSDAALSGVIYLGGSIGFTGVGDSKPLTRFVAPMKTAPGIDTGIALMGLDQTQLLQLELYSLQGNLIARASVSLGAKAHVAKFVAQFAWDTAVDFSNFTGNMIVRGTANLAATVLLVTPAGFATSPVAELP